MVRSLLLVACAGWLLVVASMPQSSAPPRHSYRHARHMSRFSSLDGFLVRMDTAEKAYNARRRDLRPEHAAAAMRTLNVPAFPSATNSASHFPATATQTPPVSNLPQHDSYEEDFDDDLDEPEEEEEVIDKQQVGRPSLMYFTDDSPLDSFKSQQFATLNAVLLRHLSHEMSSRMSR